MKPANKLANNIAPGVIPPSSEALKAMAANPDIPMIPLTTRINGDILSCSLIAKSACASCHSLRPDMQLAAAVLAVDRVRFVSTQAAVRAFMTNTARPEHRLHETQE